MNSYIKYFREICIADISIVGVTNSSLGEMFSGLFSTGIVVPDGFTTTAFAYQEFLTKNALHTRLYDLMHLERKYFSNLEETGTTLSSASRMKRP